MLYLRDNQGALMTIGNWRLIEDELCYHLRKQGCSLTNDNNGDRIVEFAPLKAEINISDLAQRLALRFSVITNPLSTVEAKQ